MLCYCACCYDFKEQCYKNQMGVPGVNVDSIRFYSDIIEDAFGGGIIYQKHREFYSVIEFVKEGEHEVDEHFEECVEEGRWLDLIK